MTHLALELQAGLGDVHGERGTLREHGRGASEAELLRQARNAAAGVRTTHASRHGSCCRRVGCAGEMEPWAAFDNKLRSLRSLVSPTGSQGVLFTTSSFTLLGSRPGAPSQLGYLEKGAILVGKVYITLSVVTAGLIVHSATRTERFRPRRSSSVYRLLFRNKFCNVQSCSWPTRQPNRNHAEACTQRGLRANVQAAHH